MLAVIRLFFIAIALILLSIYGCIYSLFRPFHRNNVYVVSKLLGKVYLLLGLKVEVRIPESARAINPAVYVCNHQNSLDMFTVANAVQPFTVTVGKKSLKWIPFFGQMYWLTGNILIDRKNTNKALNTIDLTVKKMNEKQLSVWLFPEGTRSYGRGILPFKTGAFRTAIQAQAPIIPIVASNLNHINLNRWDNGKLIIEFLEPIDTTQYKKEDMRRLANYSRELMTKKFAELNEETGYVLSTDKNDK